MVWTWWGTHSLCGCACWGENLLNFTGHQGKGYLCIPIQYYSWWSSIYHVKYYEVKGLRHLHTTYVSIRIRKACTACDASCRSFPLFSFQSSFLIHPHFLFPHWLSHSVCSFFTGANNHTMQTDWLGVSPPQPWQREIQYMKHLNIIRFHSYHCS